jgi:hypothetical protein
MARFSPLCRSTRALPLRSLPTGTA